MLHHTPETRTHKADFSAIYNQSEPRQYFEALSPLGYQIPQQALPVVRSAIAASAVAGRPRELLDVCCSYGINAALLRCAIDLEQLSAHHLRADGGLEAGTTTVTDHDFFASRLVRPDLVVHGLDAAPNAIDYALRAGLLDGGWAEDLENNAPSPQLAAGLANVGLVVCTGGVGYIGAATFDRLLGAVRDPSDLWVVTFVLRVFDYADVAEVMSRHGLVTEQLPGVTFAQRRFADDGEQRAALRDVTLRGLDPTGKESAGWFHADCFVSRPADEAAKTPVESLLAGIGPAT